LQPRTRGGCRRPRRRLLPTPPLPLPLGGGLRLGRLARGAACSCRRARGGARCSARRARRRLGAAESRACREPWRDGRPGPRGRCHSAQACEQQRPRGRRAPAAHARRQAGAARHRRPNGAALCSQRRPPWRRRSALLCSAPGAAAALVMRADYVYSLRCMPLGLAIRIGRASCVAVLRADGAQV
jgi:hypothetical protein